jgi:hypothetical protein
MKRSLKGGSGRRFTLPQFNFTFDWKKFLLYGTGVLSVCALYLWNIGGLTGGYSPQEVAYASTSNTLTEIWQNPISAPHTLLALGYGLVVSDALATRLASSTFAIVAVILFYLLIRKWHTQSVAIWSSLLFATAASMLHIGRWGGDMIVPVTFLLAFLVAGLYVKYQSENFPSWPLFGVTALVALSLYVPGMVWVVLLLCIVGRQTIMDFVSRYSAMARTYVLLLLLALLSPLVWFIVQAPMDNLLVISGFAEHPATALEGAKAVGFAPIHAFYGGYQDNELWLGKTAFLDAFSFVMVLLGGYYYLFRYRKLARSPLIISLAVLTFLLASLSGYVLIGMFVVILYIFVAAGLAEMLGRWFTIFPRNPLARNTGIVLLSCLVALSMFYNMRHYFEAWPKAPETKAVYVIQPKH